MAGAYPIINPGKHPAGGVTMVKPGPVSKKNTTNTSKKDSRLKGRSGPKKNKKKN